MSPFTLKVIFIFLLQVSETNKVAEFEGLQTKSKRMPARSWPASRPVRHLSEIRARNALREGEDMADDDALFQKGMPIRREVLGPEYVDASMARADEFMMSFQRATTAWAWGWAWGDGTLDRKTRSLMNLAMLTALNRAPEIKLHVKGALNNGVTVEEIKAALLHATAYCGIPAGLDAFRAAHEVLISEGALGKP